MDSLDLQPDHIALRPIRSVSPLGNDTFPVQLGCMVEHLLAIADQVFGVQDGQLNVVFIRAYRAAPACIQATIIAQVPITLQQVEG